jgi:cyclic pyranopterin phosphate synthase
MDQMTSTPEVTAKRLVDRFGRHVTYLRISVTDRCNFRCVYCMSKEMTFVPRSRLLTLEEIAQIARAFCELGVSKIRITGGEPLVRRNILWLFEQLRRIPQLESLVLTTNASLLSGYARDLKAAGVNRINISLDSLDPERFRRITRTGDLATVLQGIDAALEQGFDRLKLNCVVMKHRNHDETLALTRFAAERGMDISFIEEMPLGEIREHDRAEVYYSSDEILDDLKRELNLVATTESTGGPARYYRLVDSDTRVGFISPLSHNFCADCNRVRLTAQGQLLLCLGQEHASDLKRVVRSHPGDSVRLKRSIVSAMAIKPRGHEFDLQGQPVILRHMNLTGG